MERPQGDLVLRQAFDPETGQVFAYVEQADPRVLISDSIISPDGQWAPDVLPHHPAASLTDGVLTLRAVNRTVVYQLLLYVPAWHAWIAEWPD